MNAYQTALTASLLLVVAACSKVTLRDDDHKEVQAPMEGCVADLDFAAAFLLDNDAGIRGMGWTAYPSLAEEAFQRERTSAAMAESVPECTAALNRFLQSVRKGHIGASSSVSASGTPENDPQQAGTVVSRSLSNQTLYINVPSFGTGIREQLVELIEENRYALREALGLVIDLRRNGGGSDSEFEPLFELLGPATYRVIYPDILATPANVEAWEAIVPEITHPPTVERIEQVIARMKTVGDGWVPMWDVAMREFAVNRGQVKATPERVILLIGPECGSSCEQFVMMARQNERVTLMGRRTFGALDASNVREKRTPSGQISIFYATTFVKRPQGQQIDEIGIAPDIELPLPANETEFEEEVMIALEAIEAQQALPGDEPRATRSARP